MLGRGDVLARRLPVRKGFNGPGYLDRLSFRHSDGILCGEFDLYALHGGAAHLAVGPGCGGGLPVHT